MKTITITIILIGLFTITQSQNTKKMNKLTDFEKYVIIDKGTEKPFTGEYYNHKEKGTYVCKQCDAPLYKSDDKFDSHCGWPSFDDEIPGAVKRKTDADGRRTEITCANCGGHLGHVFLGENFTPKNTRHCVNSVSLKFIPESTKTIQTVYFAGGCFWGTEYYFNKKEGVISTSVGFIGGATKNPTYKEVCTGTTGHAEVVAVTYNSAKVSYEDLAKLFFEIHDFTQVNRQGPDIGDQYRSEIFYSSDKQKEITEKLIEYLTNKGYKVATRLTKATEYYEAENYHQDYYDNKGKMPTCHFYEKKFD